QNSFQALDIGRVIQSPELLEVASEFASLKEFHSGFNQKLIVLIEDAHANYSGQMNLAKTLDGLMSKYPIEQVLVEGGSGDVSLTPLRQIATPKVWNQVAKKFLLEAKLSGEEYLNLTSEHPMQLLGIEDEALYDQALNHYAALVDSRKDSLKYLHRIQIAIQKIKNQTFPKNLLQYEDFKSAHADDSNKQIDKLIELAREAKVSLTAFPALTALKSLKVIEAQIDFDQANLEQAKLMQVLSQSMPPNVFGELNALSPKSTHSREASYAFMAQLFENVVKYRLDIDDYKMLLQYSQYLNKSLRLDLGQILNETKSLEDAVYNANLTGENQLKLRQVDRFAIALRKAYNVQMDSTDFADYEAFLQQVPIYAWIAFLNRQLLDLNSFDEVIAYEEDLEESTLAINQFYESVGQRDEQFVRQTKAYLNESQAAFMIVGGYHTQNLTHLLRQAGFSYAVLTPNIDHETDHNLYESILLSEIPDIPSSNVQPNQSLRDAQKDLSLRGAERRGNLESNPLATIRTQTLATSSNRLNQLLASIGLAAPRMIAIKSELTQQVDESRLTLKRQTNKQAEPSAKEIKSSRMANRRLVKINAVLEHFADLPTVHPGLVSWILMALDAKHLDAPTVTVKRLISEVSTALDLYYQTMLDTKLSKDIRMTFLNPRLDLSPELAAKVKHTELFVAIEDARMIHDIQQLFESNDFKNKDLDLIQTHSAFQSPVDPAVPIEGVATPISMGIFEVTQNEAPINKETQTFIEEKIKTLKERREAMQLTEVTSSGKANLPFRFIEGDIAVWENLSVGADFANNIIPWYLRDSDDPHAISEIKAVVEEDQNEFLAVINGLIDDVVKNVLLEVEETTDDESTTKKKKYVWTPNQLQYLVDLRDRALTELWNQSQLRHDRIRLSALSVTRELLADDVKRLDKHNDFGLEEDQLIHIAKYFRRALRQTFYLRTRKEIDQNKENLKTALDPILKIKSPEQKIQSFVLLFELNIYPMMLAMVEGKPFVADFKSAAGALKANGFDITNFHGINIQALEGQPVSGKFVLDIFMKLLPEVFLQMGLYVQQGRDESGAAEIESILKRTIDVYEKLIQKGEATDKHAGIKKIPGEDVILATNILDPFTIVELLKHGNIAAILTNEGTVSSHFAVVAKTYGVPVFILDKVDGQKFDVTNRDLAGRKVLIETSNKKVLINPSSDSQKEFDEQRDKFQLYEDVAKHHAQKTAIPNRNGARAISVMANAEEVDQIQEAMASGAEGVALSRTELLYSNRDNPALEKYVHAYEYLQSLSPGSDVYREAQATLTSDREQLVKFFETNFTEKANATSQGNLTLRTYDLEPDKEADVPNPTKVFGVDYYRTTRGRELLKIELEGKIRANALSARGNIKILFPMYRSNAEFAKRAKDPKSLTPEDIALFQKMMREDIDLVEEIYLEAVERVKQTFDKPLKSIKLGAMIENQYMIKG
ncbi:MAG: phosphohistidine swiveling domain-containing protein, partial [Candidatus Omnitrophota bacterium]